MVWRRALNGSKDTDTRIAIAHELLSKPELSSNQAVHNLIQSASGMKVVAEFDSTIRRRGDIAAHMPGISADMYSGPISRFKPWVTSSTRITQDLSYITSGLEALVEFLYPTGE